MKAAAYARYSSENQDTASIDAQLRAMQEYADRNSISIVRVYTDEARSATTDDRPQFLQMVKDSDLGGFEAVMVHKLDRFARNRYDSAFYKRQLKRAGVRVISVLEHLDDSPESIILESVLEGMAEYYSKNLARETMKGLKENALKAKYNGGILPLGYNVDSEKNYIINETEARIVRTIFEMYAGGSSYSQIIDHLNKLGCQTKLGRSFGKNSLHEILRNEKYAGIYVYNKGTKKKHRIEKKDVIRIPGGIPAIVSAELFERVKAKMEQLRRGPGLNKSEEIYLLSGIISCGKCGSAMVGNRRFSKGKKYTSYECSERKRKRTCDAKPISKDFVESVVIQKLQEKIFSPSAIDKLAQRVYDHAKKETASINKDIALYNKELRSVQGKIDRIVNAIAEGMYHPSMKDKMDKLEKRKTELTRQLDEAHLQASAAQPDIGKIKKYLAKDANLKTKNPEDLKQVIQAYVSKVVIHESNIDVIMVVDLSGSPNPLHIKSTTYISKHRRKS